MKYVLIAGMVNGTKQTCLCDFDRTDYLIGYVQSGKFVEVPKGTKADFEDIRVQTCAAYDIHATNDEQAKNLSVEMLDIIYGSDSYSDIVGG